MAHSAGYPEAFEVVVAGGGPAGAAAAYVAARAGLRVCLIDKAAFPRDKLCGGGLTERCRSIFEAVFERPWPAPIALSSDRMAFFMDGALLARMDGHSRVSFTGRRAFDAHMAALAEAAGCRLICGDGVVAVDLDARTVRLKTGLRIGYGLLIGADGVNSLVARSLFGAPFDPRTIGFGLEVEVPREDLPNQPDDMEIDFGAARWGYGWVFPKARTFTIGVAGIHRRNPDLRGALQAYLAAKGLDPGRYRAKGQYIPFGDCRRSPGRGRVLLCGDAAGFVDPITGEGIGYALQSGAAAGRAAAVSLARPDAALARYRRAVAPIIRSIGQARGWRRLIFPGWARGAFSRAFGRAAVLRSGYLDIMAGTREYDALWGLMARQMARLPRKLATRLGGG